MEDYIKDISIQLVKSFPDNWYKDFECDDTPALDKKIEDFKAKIQELRSSVFDKLNASVLVGQYCSQSDFDEDLKNLNDEIQEITLPALLNQKVQQTFQEVLIVNFIEVLSVAIAKYRYLAKRIERRFKFDSRKLIHVSNPQIEGILNNSEFEEDVIEDLRFFDANVTIAYYDVEMRPTFNYYKNLLKCRQRISYMINQYSSLLKDKCDFLIAKWIFRQEHISKEQVISIIDNEEVVVNVDEYKPDNHLLKKWRTYIESHYELSRSWKSEIDRDYSQYKNLDFSKANLKQLHRLIKYFKDVNRNIAQITLLRKEINSRFEESRKGESDSERYCYAIALNYVLNNEFSLLIDLEPHNEQKISDFYKEILQIQSLTTIRNFFPQYKYLKILVENLETVYTQRRALNFLPRAREIITTCENVIRTYKDNVDWSKVNYNFVFQLPYSESLIDFTGYQLPRIHVFSTFLLPIYKNDYLNEFTDFKQRVINLRSSIEVFENVEPDIIEFASLKTEIKERDIKSIEIIAIFTTIVTFIAGSIPSFKYVDTAFQAGLFMFALSSSLGIFILLILSISRGLARLKENKGLIWFFLIFGILSWVCLINYSENTEKKYRALQDSRLDSLKSKTAMLEKSIDSIQTKYDSLTAVSSPVIKSMISK